LKILLKKGTKREVIRKLKKNKREERKSTAHDNIGGPNFAVCLVSTMTEMTHKYVTIVFKTSK
jgi:hypothetical protein